MPLTTQATQSIASILNAATAAGPAGIPGLSFIAVDSAGHLLTEHVSGTQGLTSPSPITPSTTFHLASFTKLVTTIAALQLVERGVLSLDDPTTVTKYAPEIAAKKVYADGVTPAEQDKPVTLRMLLAHTAGFGYSFFDVRVQARGRPAGFDEFSGDKEDIVNSPLVNQPGSMWEYSVSVDWAGIIVERATGAKLGAYFREHVFAPLGVEQGALTFFPDAEKTAYMHQRDSGTGEVSVRDHLCRRAFHHSTPEQQDEFFHSGGAGLFGEPRAYVKILAMLLNGGVAPDTGAKVLKQGTVDMMFENQIPDQPDFARAGVPPSNPLLANATKDVYPQGGNPPQGWGLSWFLTLQKGETGRGANTAFWAGIANCYYWVDRERGVAGVFAAQVLPFGDQRVVETWVKAEKAVYDGLE